MSLFRSPIIVLDTETTGFPSHRWAQVIEIGAVQLDGDGEVVGTFSSLVHGVLDARADKALEVNGITREEVASAPSAAVVIGGFLSWARPDRPTTPVFVTSFNVDFDRPMAERMGLQLRWANCIMLRAMELMGPAGALRKADPTHPRFDPARPFLWPSLAAAGEFFDVPVCEPAHRALSDARRAAGVAVAIQKRARVAA